MAKPKCPKCGGTDFMTEHPMYKTRYEKRIDVDIYMVYCTKCGHIVGCAGSH